MIDEYETETIINPTRPQMVDLMEDGLDLLAEHCGCTYTVKTKSQGNYEAVIDAGGGMYFRVVMTPQEANLNRENFRFDRGHISGGEFVSDQYFDTSEITYNEHYASVISVNNGAAWIFCYNASTILCMCGVTIKSSITGDTYLSGSVYFAANERRMWPDTNDNVNLPSGTSRVYAIDNFDNARYCVPTDKVMLYPSLITFENKRHLGVPTIGDEPVYWMVRNTRITPWREYYVGGAKYVTLGHVSVKSLAREEET